MADLTCLLWPERVLKNESDVTYVRFFNWKDHAKVWRVSLIKRLCLMQGCTLFSFVKSNSKIHHFFFFFPPKSSPRIFLLLVISILTLLHRRHCGKFILSSWRRFLDLPQMIHIFVNLPLEKW